MVVRGAASPKKLKNDAIIEALLEIRFDVSATLPELYYARLSELPEWKSFQQLRLPAYEIPPAMRAAEPNLRFAPVLQLAELSDSPRVVRMGPQVLSYHRAKTYGGWGNFRPELETMIDALFAAIPKVVISRLGLRYMNGLNRGAHGIGSISDLDFSLKVADEVIADAVNVNYSRNVPEIGTCMVKIATPDFVQGGLPENTTVFIDVDVFTKGEIAMKDAASVKSWTDRAHEVEKNEFFHLLTQASIEALQEN
jgi:uncharacterized protein (TIGR04255 family)